MRFLAFLMIGLVCFLGCVPEKDITGSSQKAANNGVEKTAAVSDDKTITIFLSGDILSQLQPCGCAEGQLGGFSSRQGIFDKVPANRRLLVDTGNFLIDNTPQDLIKLNTIITSLITLEYDVINFSEDDLSVSEGRFPIKQLPFKAIGTVGKLDSVFRKNFPDGDKKAAVTIASISSEALEEGTIDQDGLAEIFPSASASKPDSPPVNILILDGFSKSIADYLADTNIDVVVCDNGNYDPEVIKTDHKSPIFVNLGRLGKYIWRIDVKLSEKLRAEISYTKIAVDKKLPGSDELDDIYEAYREMIQEEDILGQVTRTPLPDGLKYVGSDKCKDCHEDEYEIWAKQKHAHAYQTLVDSGDAYDPECIECHVIGLKLESGFENANSPKGLRNVGCEICHGPRSKHIKNATDNTENLKKSEPIAALKCISCHTPEHSPGFQADEAGYRKKIIHWMEPKSQ
jgi:hypothetical protein